MSNILSIDNVTVRFGGLVALDEFHLTLPKGQIVGIIGPNGAGKTTVFNIITGVYRPFSGSVRILEKELIGLSPHAIAHFHVLRTFQNIRLFANMSVLENIIASSYMKRKGSFLRDLFGIPDVLKKDKKLQEDIEDVLALTELGDLRHSMAVSLPYGMQRKLEIAKALIASPHLLLLDEPAAGMNPTEKNKLQDIVRKISARGISILLIEHDMSFVMNLCSHITVLNYGKVIATGTPNEIRTNQAVIEAYLGSENDE